MNKKLWLLWVIAAVAVFSFWGSTQASCLWTGASCSENVTVQVEILPGDICIGNTWSFDFGQYTVSASSQTQTWTFTSEFRVEDLKGADTGYYTTVQLSGNMTGPGAATIPAANVSMKVDSTAVTVMAGSSNPGVTVAAGLLVFTPLNSAVTFIQRPNAANSGLIGQYGKIPEMEIVIPAYQSVGTYTATLVYTIYEN